MNLGFVWVGFGTYWGVFWDPQPRFAFQALLPFLLAATLLWHSKPSRWPWLMVAAGLLIYVHPVSTPAWAFAIWLSLVLAIPGSLKNGKHLAYLFSLGFLFLLATAPFLYNYLAHHAHGQVTGAEYETVRALMQEWYGRDFLNIPNGLRRFAMRWLWLRMFFWLFAGAGVLYLFFYFRRCRPRLRMIIHWAAGIALISIILPYVEQEICRVLQMIPPEIDLGRGIRYFVPLMLLLFLWPLAATEKRWGRRAPAVRRAARTFGALLVAVWIYWHPVLRLDPWTDCWRSGRLMCRPEAWDEKLEALDAVRSETVPGSRFLPGALALELRYYALRPVVHTRKDKGLLSYTDHAAFLTWNDLHKRRGAIAEIEDRGERFAAWRALGAELRAEYLLLDRVDLPAEPRKGPDWEVVWHNDRFSLVRLVGMSLS